MSQINIGIVGVGTVGGGVVKALDSRIDYFNKALGLDIRLARIADRATTRFSQLPVRGAVCTADSNDILNDDSVNIVVELAGGTGFARKLVLEALKRGKHVVTANKALIAEHGPEIFETADKAGVSLYFEASVGGGMPVIKAIREGLVGNDILSIRTIINGTCNYILTQMAVHGLPFADALAAAQENGYAEADPALDVGGGDSGHKVAILASLAGGGYVPYGAFSVEGITGIAREDIAFAAELGYVVKLLGIVKRGAGGFDVRVHPAMLPKGHILASVSDVFNAVLIEGGAVGQILLYGRGAGEMPTASAVLGDIVDAARNIADKCPKRVPMDYYRTDKKVALIPIEQVESRYYLRFNVSDNPGVLASITSRLGAEKISIASVMQKERAGEAWVPVIIITHRAVERGVRKAILEIEKEAFVRMPTQIIRIEE